MSQVCDLTLKNCLIFLIRTRGLRKVAKLYFFSTFILVRVTGLKKVLILKYQMHNSLTNIVQMKHMEDFQPSWYSVLVSMLSRLSTHALVAL